MHGMNGMVWRASGCCQPDLPGRIGLFTLRFTMALFGAGRGSAALSSALLTA